MKKIIIMMVLILGVCFITGCKKEVTKNETENEPKTVALELTNTFESVIKTETDIEKVAQKLADSEILVPEVQIITIKKGDYLAGFKEEITGYKKAVGISPMISTIPMIAYVFEVEDTETFRKKLEENADLRWNICTEADEMKISVVDNYIFFIMSPSTFEE